MHPVVSEPPNESPKTSRAPVASDAESKHQARSVEIEIDDDLCKGCEICVTFCPLRVFEKSEQLNRRGYHVPVIVNPDACNACRLCDLLCPELAIIITKK